MRKVESFLGNDLEILKKNINYFVERNPRLVLISISFIKPIIESVDNHVGYGPYEALVIFEISDIREYQYQT